MPKESRSSGVWYSGGCIVDLWIFHDFCFWSLDHCLWLLTSCTSTATGWYCVNEISIFSLQVLRVLFIATSGTQCLEKDLSFQDWRPFFKPMQLQQVQSPFSMPSRPYCTDSILLDYIRMLHNHFVCIVKICCIVSVCMFCISDCTVSCNEGLQWSGLALREMPGSWLLRRGQ